MNMIKAAIVALLITAGISPAIGQSAPAKLPGQSVYGRLGVLGDTGPGQAIPISRLNIFLLNSLCQTNGAFPIYSTSSGAWICSPTQTANRVFAGPSSGSAALAAFRALVGADLPLPAASTLGGVMSKAAVASNWLRSIGTDGIPTASQPAFTDITGSIAVAQVNSGTGAGATTFHRGDNTWSTAVTSVVCGTGLSGNTITTSGTCSARAPTLQAFSGSVSATYTTPSNVSAIKVTLCGATGGGAGSGTGTTGGTGGTPSASTFSGGTLSCAGGVGGTASAAGTGATCTGASAFILAGKDGQAVSTGIAGNFLAGPLGGATPFVGTTGGRGGFFNGAGNTGGGGGGAGCAVQYIPSPAATYSYVLQAGGTAGTAGTSGSVGIVGDPSKLIVEEF